MLGRPKSFIALGSSIAAMALGIFNTYRIAQLYSEISSQKSNKDLLMFHIYMTPISIILRTKLTPLTNYLEMS